MTSKYSTLPDIDTWNPDVYETPDVPESFSFGHESDSDSDEHPGLSTSGSGSNLLASAAGRNSTQNGSAADEAIDSARLDPKDARAKFIQSNILSSVRFPGASTSRPVSARSRYAGSLLPDAPTYTLRNGSARGLSSTARRQMKLDARIAGTDGASEPYEPETPTERLRRLRFEMEELETELEQKQASKVAAGGGAASESEYEEDSFPKRDDADKTRPTRRKKKKKPVDDNGELSPSVLLSQLKRLRGNMSDLHMVEGDGDEGGPVSTINVRQRTQELLEKLGKGKETDEEAPEVENDTGQRHHNNARVTTSEVDVRLQRLEKYIGADEAETDDTRPLPPPLLSTLARLEHQLHLLTQPRHLDTISRRVKVLVTDLERVHEARRKIGDTRPLNVALSSGITISTGPAAQIPTSSAQGEQLPPDALQKIESLFTLLPRIDPLIPLTPHLLTRLKSLSILHSSASTFEQDMRDTESHVTSLKQSVIFITDLLEGLEDSLKSNQDLVKNNLQGLQDRIEGLMQRLEKLDI